MNLIPSISRFLIHVPVGMLAGNMLRNDPALGAAFTGMFALYEIAEHIDIKDNLWKDVNGFLGGAALDYGIHKVRQHVKKREEVK